MNLVSELKRRNVHRMVVLYVVAAWLIMQVAEVIIGLANLPHWIGPTILGVLAVGFPIALLFSWFYELTPEGISLDKDTDPGESIGHVTGRRLDLIVISLLCAAVILFAYDKWWVSAPPIASIAVLPLDNLSGDPEQEYFTDGMTEALTAELGQINDLKVISRTSAMRYRGTDKLMPEIAQELGVDALLEGSVLRAGNEVRITLQLIHGATDRHLWARNFQRELHDVLALQSEVARAIADEIHITLTPSLRERLDPAVGIAAAREPDPAAYDAYLKGRYNFNRGGGDGFVNALRYYEEAIDLDPEFAVAYAALAEVCVMGPVLFAQLRTLDDCSEAAVRAVEADPDLAEGHAALGTVRQFQWRWAESEAEYKKAIDLNPNSVMAHQWYGELLRITMRLDEALTEIRHAEALDPFNLMVKTMVGWPLLSARRYDEALAQWQDVLEMEPDNFIAHFVSGVAYVHKRDVQKLVSSISRLTDIRGENAFEVKFLTAAMHAIRNEEEEALAIIDEIERNLGQSFAAGIAGLFVLLGQEEAALDRLEAGYVVRALDLPTTLDPQFDPLRDNPRFKALRRKLGLP